MKTFNIHEAKTQLSKLVELAASGEGFIIAKAGRPMVKVVALDTPETKQVKRIGFLEGQFNIPDDFDTMASEEIRALFEGDE
jgi:antitoxin (DNA-binding transcriptional repressor) of toxin-antitoxin stability system